MQLSLVSDEDMAATKSRKTKKDDKIDSSKMTVTHVTKPISIVKDEEYAEDRERKERVVEVEPPMQGNILPERSLIIKRIYFPGDVYSKNQVEFKKILAAHGLAWNRSMMKTYTGKTGNQILTGVYASSDGNKKIFCIYEGTNKPMTAIVKILGTGGILLIDLQGFCHNVGCIPEDKDEIYVNNVLLTLQEKGEVYVEKILNKLELEEFQKEFNEKVKKYTEEILAKWMDANKDVLILRGFNPENIAKFRRMEIEDDVKYALENGFIDQEKEWIEKYRGVVTKGIKERVEEEKDSGKIVKDEKEIEKQGERKEIEKVIKDEKRDIFYKEFEEFIRTNLAKSNKKYMGAQVGGIVELARKKGLLLEDGVQGVQKFLEELATHFKSIGIDSKIKNDYIYFEKK